MYSEGEVDSEQRVSSDEYKHLFIQRFVSICLLFFLRSGHF